MRRGVGAATVALLLVAGRSGDDGDAASGTAPATTAVEGSRADPRGDQDSGNSRSYPDEEVVTSNVGEPETNAPGTTTQVFALDPASGDVLWEVELEDTIDAPVSASPGVVYVGTTAGLMLALDSSTGEELWRFEAPNSVGAGPAVVDGTVLWGYGFALFEGPGDGGLLAFGPAGA